MAMSRALSLVVTCALLRPSCAGWQHRQFPRAEGAQPATVAPATPAPWDVSFERGLRESEAVVEALREGDVGGWASDGGAGVPSRMLAAEVTLREAIVATPEGRARVEKTVGLATRLYAHAKWLAERQHSTAAEQRYRDSAEAALGAGHVALATHSLSRLGYFLKLWGRTEDAKRVLQKAIVVAEKVPNGEASHVAFYLLGSLQRIDAIATADVEGLFAADARILAAGKLPSKELEAERCELTGSIGYWKEAEASPSKCLHTSDLAHVFICLWSHLARTVHQALA